MYKSTVAATAMLEILRTLSGKWLLIRNSRKIASNIDLIESSDGSGIFSTWKCLINLGVRGERPPPGGAAAQITLNFSIIFQ